MKTLTVNYPTPYQVVISNGLSDFSSPIKPNKVMVVTDDKLAPLYLKDVTGLFSCKVVFHIIKNGEKSKNIAEALKLVELLVDENFSSSDLIVGLGGGVVGDLCQFVASIFKRGINFISLPTTIIAMTDSSIGGKTAVDFNGLKNTIGTYYNPKYVYINLDFLKTLDKAQVKNGYGELIKYALLTGRLDISNIDENLVYDFVKYKIEITTGDYFDKGNRRLLNLGHTIGHAIEALSNYTLLHGECVYKGIYKALEISQKLYGLPSQKVLKIKNYLDSFNLDSTINYSNSEIMEKIAGDKKAFGNSICFATIYDFGDIRLENLSLKTLGELL